MPLLPDCSRECRNRRRDLRLQLSKWSHKVLLCSGIEEILVRLSHFDPDCGPPLTESSREVGTSLSTPDWSPSARCVMCEVGQSTPTDKVETVAAPKQSPSSSSKSNGLHHLPSPEQIMQAQLQYDMFMHLFVSNMNNMNNMNPNPLAGSFNGLTAGVTHPDFTSLVNFAAAMSKLQPGHKGSLPPMLPFPPHPMMHHLTLMPPPPPRQKATGDKPNALDLSRKSGLQTTVAVDKRAGAVKGTKRRADAAGANEIEEPPKAPSGPGMKRNYTQADLDKAVTDIRCGRLGTRRASVVYGIPRSTLRNKIYKLEAADEQAGITPIYKRRKAGGQSSAEKMLADVVELTARNSIKRELSAVSTPAESPETPKSASPIDEVEVKTEVKEEIKEEEMDVEEVAVKEEKEEHIDVVETEDEETDLVQASLRTLAEMAGTVPPQESPIAPEATATANIVENPAVNMDILNQVLRNCLAAPALPFDFLANNLLMQAAVDPVEKHLLNGNSLLDESAVSPTGGDWKKARPKRGQYRKYDKESLDEAVQSVRRGEMSVHRAGSYYGVPHSTLEYKVKERNLAKPSSKPRDGSQVPSEDCDSSPSPTQEQQGNNNTNEPMFTPQFTAVV